MSTRPNIVLIYADDLGFGDVRCFDPRSRIATPHIDALAEQGVRFTDAHAPDAICSPSRYGILTGRYSWRTERKKGNPAPGEQPWIDADRLTLASMLKECGYDTAALGKWGLGSDWASAARPSREGLDISPTAIDYSKPIHSGRCVGFTYDDLHLWYGKSYYERTYPFSQEPDAFDTVDGGRWYFENGLSRGGEPRFEAFDMEEAQMYYIRRAVDYIDNKGTGAGGSEFNTRSDAPFFLYYAPHIPHVPHVPAPQFQGTTPMGYYGDFVAQLDWAVGRIVEALKRNGMFENTVVIFTSDNGPERQCYTYIDKYAHFSMGPWRGIKRDAWEGGHRTPFVLSWPGVAPAGTLCPRLISQTDILATLADYLDYDLEDGDAEDSLSFLDEFLEDASGSPRRDMAIHHTADNKLALRQGNWVYVDDPSGDNGDQEPEWFRGMRGVRPHQQRGELFDLTNDPKQRFNRYSEQPEQVARMKEALKGFVESGRTAPRRGRA